MLDGRALACALAIAIAIAPDARAGGRGDRIDPTPTQIQAARELFADASKDEDAGRWESALEKLHRVSDVKLTAGIRYHIALCEEKLGLTATALAHYGDALQAANAEHNKEVIELLKEPFLGDLRARVPSLALNVPRDVSDVEVTVDGQRQPSGLWGVGVPIDPGTHRIEAHAPGRRPFAREIAMRDRDATVMDVTLHPEPPAVASSGVAPSGVAPSGVAPSGVAPSGVAPAPRVAPATAARTDASVAMTTPATPVHDDRAATAPAPANRIGAIVATAGALVLAGGGVGAYLHAGSEASDARDRCRTQTSCDDRRSPVRTWDGVALGAWIGAAALGTIAVVLWATPSRAAGPERTSRVVLGPGAVRLEGSF
jgi:hypothetical protein